MSAENSLDVAKLLICPHCGEKSRHHIINKRRKSDRTVQNYICCACGKLFNPAPRGKGGRKAEEKRCLTCGKTDFPRLYPPLGTQCHNCYRKWLKTKETAKI